MDKIPLLDLPAQYQQLKTEIDEAIERVLNSGNYILGDEVQSFEINLAQYLGAKHAIGVASGSDALLIALHALGIGSGDKVIVPTFTFFATASSVTRLGAIPIFVDMDNQNYNLDLKQTEYWLDRDPDIKAIVPVHLFGKPVNMEKLISLAVAHSVVIVEDACQAIDADIEYHGRLQKAGTVGVMGCFSFFPSKNLGCYGDGGMVVTNSDELADKIRLLRVHGSKPKYYHQAVGYNSRLDAIQAAILNVKLKYLPAWTTQRRQVAQDYNDILKDIEGIALPLIGSGDVFHQYVIQVNDRDNLQKHLSSRGIGTAIYYPQPLHMQECFSYLGYQKGDLPVAETVCNKVIALPIDPSLSQEKIKYIGDKIKEFYQGF